LEEIVFFSTALAMESMSSFFGEMLIECPLIENCGYMLRLFPFSLNIRIGYVDHK
jgi:hypothetical protein